MIGSTDYTKSQKCACNTGDYIFYTQCCSLIFLKQRNLSHIEIPSDLMYTFISKVNIYRFFLFSCPKVMFPIYYLDLIP